MSPKKIKITDSRYIGDDEPVFIIAEIGSNHNQDLELAKRLIEVAADVGADAVKFQSIQYAELYGNSNKGENQSIQKLHRQIDLQEEWYGELSEHAKKCGVLFFSAPTYLRAIQLLEQVRVSLYKIASPQAIAFPQLIQAVAETQKPIILSTGYCLLDDIDHAIDTFRSTGNNKIIILHCISEYPTDPDIANLRFMPFLGERYEVLFGLSDHTPGYTIPIAAVAMGATVIEKHITLSRLMPGPDHHFALEPDEFRAMVKNLRNIEKSLGSGIKTTITDNEKEMKAMIDMKVIVSKDIQSGEVVQASDLQFRRLVNGLSASEVYNKKLTAIKNITCGSPITHDNIRVVEYI